MPTRSIDDFHEARLERDRALEERSEERFDRCAFAVEALGRVRPARVTVAVCEGSRLRLETGRVWGGGEAQRWALLSVPPDASRRAIAAAVASLARESRPYAIDLLFAEC